MDLAPIRPGQTFKKWTVMAGPSVTGANYAKLWTCQCACGSVKEVRQSNLLSGKSGSCGCLHEVSRETRQRLSDRMRGRQATRPKGFTVSEETRAKIRESHQRRKAAATPASARANFRDGRGIMGPLPQSWLYCVICERAFLSNSKNSCSYHSCAGDLGDVWEWDVLTHLNHGYPETPVPGLEYPLFGSREFINLSKAPRSHPSR
jgi:hypothetical protein